MDCISWGVSFSSCRNSVFSWTRLMGLLLWGLTRGQAVPPGPSGPYFTYLATFRAAVAWEMPSSLATATVVPQRR